MKALSVTAKYNDGEQEKVFTVKGQTAKSLMALVEAGDKGRTAQETASWALRFAAYCHNLIHNHGLSIRMDREKHDGGWHGRHVLETPVEIIKIVAPERREGAE